MSILNRTAQVNSEGIWQVANVPAGQGPVRARVVCVENGITRFGVSDWLNVPPNGVVFSAGIEFEAPPPIPARMTLAASRTSLDGIGDTVQLSAMVEFPDGSTHGVPTSADGTSYTTSNDRIVSISPSGLVSAAGAGTAIVSATNEGSLAMLRISVTSGQADSDGDGMPNDWELTFNLNPNDPSDAARDGDGDGLSNLQEYEQQTDPWNADTDGDGIRDGLEVQVGTDPLDPNSYDLARSLRELVVTPSALPLVVNEVYGEALRLLTVRGELLDGTYIDLRSASRGTTYETGHGAVASFTSIDGEVRAGGDGVALITVKNNGFIATTTATVSHFSSESYAPFALPGYGNDIACQGVSCYVASGAGGLRVINVATPSAPVALGSYPTRGNSNAIAVSGGFAYVADGTAGLLIIDVSVPAAPAIAAQYDTPGSAYGVAIADGIAYVADDAFGVHLIDVTNPGNPVLRSTFNAGGTYVAVGADGRYMTAGSMQGVLYVVDTTDPAAPVRVGEVNVGGGVRNVVLRGNIAYVSVPGVGMRIVDITVPEHPRLAGRPDETATRRPFDFAPRGGIVIAGDLLQNGGVLAIDSGDINAPFLRARFPAPNYSTSVAASYTHVFNTAGTSALPPRTTGTSSLYAMKYVSAPESDFTKPIITFVSAPPTEITEGSTFQLQVAAADDSGVSAVEVYVNGRLASARSVRPFVHTIRVPKTDLATIEIIVDDFTGNVVTGPQFTIPVRRDTTPPTVSISAPTAAAGTATVPVAVTATDAADVYKVDLYVNGQFFASDQAAPFTFSVTMPNQNTVVVLEARGTDALENVGVGSHSIQVSPDQPPTIALLAPVTATVLYDRAFLIIRASALDDVTIRPYVEIYVDGVRRYRESHTNLSFGNLWYHEYWYDVPAGTTSITIQAVAIDGSNQSASTAPLTLAVKPTSLLGSLTWDTGAAFDLDVFDHRGYVAAGSAGLQIIDLSNEYAPALLGTVDTPGIAREVRALGRYVFLADGTGGLQVIDVSTPSSPAVVASAATTAGARSLQLLGERLYVGTDEGLDIFDIRNPRAPVKTNSLRFASTGAPTAVYSLAARGNDLVVLRQWETPPTCSNCGILSVHGLANPDQPVLIGQIGPELPPNLVVAAVRTRIWVSLAVQGNTAYVINHDVMHTFDLSQPTPQVYLGFSASNDGYYRLKPRGRIGFLAWADTNKKASALMDLTNPSNLFANGTMYFPTTFFGTGIAGTGELVYSVGPNVSPVSITPTTVVQNRLYVNRYETVTDSAGIAPSLTLHASSTLVTENQAVTLVADATDDVSVRAVTFSMDGNEIGTDTTHPYEMLAIVPVGVHTFAATATDYAGSSTQSTAVTVTANTAMSPSIVRMTTPPNAAEDAAPPGLPYTPLMRLTFVTDAK